MRLIHLNSSGRVAAALITLTTLAAVSPQPGLAQNIPDPLSPAVWVTAPDHGASEPGTNTGRFVLRRSGATNAALFVQIALGGTAVRGVDYTLSLPDMTPLPPVQFAAGVVELPLIVTPLDDLSPEPVEAVILSVLPPAIAMPMPGVYRVGSPSNAVINIEDNDPVVTHHPPSVQIIQPTNGAGYVAPVDIPLAASATDPDGEVVLVQFYRGTNLIGTATNNPLAMGPINPFVLVWSNAPAGVHELRAKARDNREAWSVSAPVTITVKEVALPPVVTITALDAVGAEVYSNSLAPLNPLIFSVRREGPTNTPLEVLLEIHGRASNGIDYSLLPDRVTIPAGVPAQHIFVNVLDDALIEGDESVVISILPIACPAIMPPPPGCYLVGRPSAAEGVIHDNDMTPPTNRPPRVAIVRPPNGAVLMSVTNVGIEAVTMDPDGYASCVEFFANGGKIGEQEIVFIQPPPPGTTLDFSLVWSNVVAGEYALTARTRDNLGLESWSEPVKIFVLSSNVPPTTNCLPVVSITAVDACASEGLVCFGPHSPLGAVVWDSTNNIPITNTVCITNVGVFRISRTGGTSNELVVPLTIGGTASNGVDYLRLPEQVTIPAGERSVRLKVVPIDDAVAERVESVIVRLTPPTTPMNAAPTCVLGRRSAAVFITDNDRPRPPTMTLSDRVFLLTSQGTNGQCFRIEASTNLVHWTPLCTNVVVDGAVHFADPDAPEMPNRYYRVLPESQPPAE